MASLADLFNPTFLMFLGILVLIVAVLVVYFESKMREQNNKISSMLSLVSTLAEDLYATKHSINNHLAIVEAKHQIIENNNNNNNLGIKNNSEGLIEVSDDEYDDDDKDENVSVEDSENNDSEYDDYESDNDNENINDDESCDSNGDIKVLKLSVANDENSELDENNDLEDTVSLGDFEQLDDIPDVTNDYVEEVLDLKYDLEEKNDNDELKAPSELKTISINLGEEPKSNDVNIDFKKLQLPKLRSIVIEKGLANSADATKLKKPELLKLLGIE